MSGNTTTGGPQALRLSELNQRVGEALSRAPIHGVWVVAELSDARVNHGHCYMELIEKDPTTGSIIAKMKGVIWVSNYSRLNTYFAEKTGQKLGSGLKIMVYGSINFHAAYGMTFVITDINPSFTIGEIDRRRREILQRLTNEGVIDLNRALEWPDVVQRIAIISAQGAAGYGDFIHQLYTNTASLRFTTELFPAVLQGDRTPSSVINALDRIARRQDEFDCVVMIRGGGATSDLVAFDNYELALNVAQFPLPVIVGIGHERDVTVLDYVGKMRVKTPTAAAEWLIEHGTQALERVHRLASQILQTATDRISGAKTQLAYMESTLAMAPQNALSRAQNSLQRSIALLSGISGRRILPELARLKEKSSALSTAAFNITFNKRGNINHYATLLEAIRPEATLRRGYTITMVDGHAVADASAIPEGAVLTTILANGTVKSIKTNE